MSNDVYKSFKPNLAKLPPHISSQMSKAVPMRPGEVHGKVTVFKETPGLIHPTARVFVTNYVQLDEEKASMDTPAQIDLLDFSGRISLATLLLDKEATAVVLQQLMQAYLKQGATPEDLASLIPKETLHVPVLPNPLFIKDGSDNE